ncbi:MAG: DUF4301 family protein [Desulfosarcina sp.]|nr:DUF4301 family protein [Desulfobacterales bacterium]
MFNNNDLIQIKDMNLTISEIISQIELFKKSNLYLNLQRSCKVDDGITVLDRHDTDRLAALYTKESLSGRTMKFVPASGAASRMFKVLHSLNNLDVKLNDDFIKTEEEADAAVGRAFGTFLKGIRNFAFYDDLKAVLQKNGLELDHLLAAGEYKDVLEYILTPKGLNYGNLPKGLIPFHKYSSDSRTPFEEHMAEAAEYTKDHNGLCKIHFTVAPGNAALIREHLDKISKFYKKSGTNFNITYSYQKPSTDTLAVDEQNNPFRETDGKLLFRPGGHGALLDNLNSVKGDIIFLKNIDNVVPDRLKQDTFLYKKALGGFLVELQNEIFTFLRKLSCGDINQQNFKKMFKFIRHRLLISIPNYINDASEKEQEAYIFSKLNRPLRVCGMVRNVGEPGGGPFWVEGQDKNISRQIVESSQIDPGSKKQQSIIASATHFNPVDIVCGVRDFQGNQFDLKKYVDNEAVFISNKSKNGRPLKALELPGLWNGAMSFWNTVFIEVPEITFNPVKTVNDLLRAEHQS